MDIEAWVLARDRAALAKARGALLALALVLASACAWLGVRQAHWPSPKSVRAALEGQAAAQARFRLKQIALVAYLAKVRNNSFLVDVTGSTDLEGPCRDSPTLVGLPDSSPCASAWDEALGRIWAKAFGQGAPPIPDRLRRDPWGSPYMLNQSETSCGHFGSWCPPDTIISAGPGGKPGTSKDILEAVPQFLGPSRVQ